MLISAAIVMGTSDVYEATQWRMYLIFLGIIIFTTVSNLYGNRILGYWSDAARKCSMPG
jgi:choline transport protein